LGGNLVNEIPKVCFDTNIFVDYFWAIFRKANSKVEGFRLKLPKPLNLSLEVFEKYKEGRFDLYYNAWGYWELKNVIKRQLFQHKCISFGYQMPKDYYRALDDKVPESDKEELKIFYSLLLSLLEFMPDGRKAVYEINLKEIGEMVIYDCDFMDAILFFQSYKNDCDFFVTRDEKFMDYVAPYCYKRKIKTKPIKLVDFLTRIQPNTCWECGGKMEVKHEQHEVGSKTDDEPDGYKVIDYAKCQDCGKKIIYNEEIV